MLLLQNINPAKCDFNNLMWAMQLIMTTAVKVQRSLILFLIVVFCPEAGGADGGEGLGNHQ
jgi:hypothetical protein